MMKLGMRILALSLALVVGALSLFGCSSATEKQEQTVIGSCAGYDVLYEELRYVTLTYKDMFESTYGDGIWDNPESAERYRAELEETVWRVMLNNYAVLSACKYYMPQESIEDEKISKAVDDVIAEMIESYGSKQKYREALKDYYTTEHFLRFTLTVAELENELFHVLTEDLGLIENDADAFYDWLIQGGNCAYVQHIYVANDKGEDVEANRQKAEEARSLLITGEKTLSEMVGSSYNEDLTNTKPYYVIRDVYVEEIETAALSLRAVGDVSPVIETPDGFYIFVRVGDSEAFLLAQIEGLLESYQWAKVEDIAQGFKSGISVELNEYGKSIDLLAIK